MTDNVKEIMAGNVYEHEPNAYAISVNAYTIISYAIKLDGCRSRHSNGEHYQDQLLKEIEKMRSELDIMEKWAKMEKPE